MYSTTAVLPYLLSLAPPNSNSLDGAFDAIASYEQKLLEVLLGFLAAPEQFERGIRVVGDDKVGMGRVPTVSFVVTGQRAMKSKDIVNVFDAKGGVSAPRFRLTNLLKTMLTITGWDPLRALLRIYPH